ncbi:MAG TPA: DUF3592 domain-containing protein [Ktedonosporobacter sp.]|jgi:hypothetical protein|nr:DUF3592 domain-containing protein [Ktedonosporobacter sp.]
MFRYRTLGGWLCLALLALGYVSIKLITDTNFLAHGITAQGVIVDQGVRNCGRSTTTSFSVRFTGPTGQTFTSTISTCDYNFNASPGEKVSIVYLPGHPDVVAPSDQLNQQVNFDWQLTFLVTLIALIPLTFWIIKESQKIYQQKRKKSAAFLK